MVPLLRPLVAVTLALLLSGCFVEKDPEAAAQEVADALGSRSASASGAPASNHAPQAGNLTFNATGLEVAFVLAATDADGDALSWTLSFGDNASANGTFAAGVAANASVQPPGAVQVANATHAYAQGGSYNLTLVVSDGKASANRTYNLTLAPAAAAPVQDPIHLEGSVVCLPTLVVDGELAGDSQSFDVLAGQRTMTLTLDFGAGEVDDLDFTVTDPSGTATESAEAGPEPPMALAAPAAGTWTLDVAGYSCAGQADYTMDITFG